MNAVINPPPWYRQLWPWLLISVPGVAVIGGFVMLYLAINGADSLVVDDYYKQGKAINQRIARDRAATEMQLQAQMQPVAAGISLRLDGANFEAPVSLSGRFVHIARADLDQPLRFDRTAAGDYLAGVRMPESGWWRVHIEDPAGKWRLVSEKWHAGTNAPIRLTAHEAAPATQEKP